MVRKTLPALGLLIVSTFTVQAQSPHFEDLSGGLGSVEAFREPPAEQPIGHPMEAVLRRIEENLKRTRELWQEARLNSVRVDAQGVYKNKTGWGGFGAGYVGFHRTASINLRALDEGAMETNAATLKLAEEHFVNAAADMPQLFDWLRSDLPNDASATIALLARGHQVAFSYQTILDRVKDTTLSRHRRILRDSIQSFFGKMSYYEDYPVEELSDLVEASHTKTRNTPAYLRKPLDSAVYRNQLEAFRASLSELQSRCVPFQTQDPINRFTGQPGKLRYITSVASDDAGNLSAEASEQLNQFRRLSFDIDQVVAKRVGLRLAYLFRGLQATPSEHTNAVRKVWDDIETRMKTLIYWRGGARFERRDTLRFREDRTVLLDKGFWSPRESKLGQREGRWDFPKDLLPPPDENVSELSD